MKSGHIGLCVMGQIEKRHGGHSLMRTLWYVMKPMPSDSCILSQRHVIQPIGILIALLSVEKLVALNPGVMLQRVRRKRAGDCYSRIVNQRKQFTR